MQNPLLTNILLAVIAALLLVQVVQNGMTSSSRGPGPMPMPMMMNPHGSGEGVASSEAPTQTMNHSLFEQALSGFPDGCDKNQTLAVCNSPAAQAVKAELNDLVSKGAAPRQVFDYVVNKYGMNALTEQAQRIRSMRKPAK